MSEDGTSASKLSRRDFLKAAALGLGVAAAPKWIKRLGENETNSEIVLENIEPTFRIGWHALLDKDIQPQRAVIGGELDYRSIEMFQGNQISNYPQEDEYKKRSSDMAFLQPSTKSGAEHTKVHKRALEAAKKQGTQIIACDSVFWESVGVDRFMDSLKTGNERFLMLTFAALGGSVAKLGKIVYGIRSGKGLEKSKEFWDKVDETSDRMKEIEKQYPNTSFAIKGGLSYWLGTKFGDLNKTGEGFGNMLISTEKFLVGIQDHELAELNDLTEVRNLSMSLNYRIGLSILDRLPQTKNKLLSDFNTQDFELFYFAGSGHIGSKVTYREGENRTQERLYKLQKKTISKFKKRINDSLGDDKKLEEQIKYFVLNSSAFSFPIASFMNSEEYSNTALQVNYSPRANYWSLLLNELQENPNDQATMIMVEAIMTEDKAFFEKLEKSIPQIKQKSLSSSLCQSIVDFKLRNQDYQLRFVDGIPVVGKKTDFEEKPN